MAYLAIDDYTLRIGVTNLNEILYQASENTGLTPDNIRTNAESWAQAMIKSYLGAKYGVNTELQINAPNPRNFQVMQVMIDLALCTLHKTINPRDVPDHIFKACDEAMEWLKAARDGTISVDLSSHVVGEDRNPARTYFASQVKFISKPWADGSTFDDHFID